MAIDRAGISLFWMRPVRARCFARLRLSRNCKCWAHCDIWFCNLNCLIAKLPFATGGNGSIPDQKQLFEITVDNQRAWDKSLPNSQILTRCGERVSFASNGNGAEL